VGLQSGELASADFRFPANRATLLKIIDAAVVNDLTESHREFRSIFPGMKQTI
jgi:hypothetical protein